MNVEKCETFRLFGFFDFPGPMMSKNATHDGRTTNMHFRHHGPGKVGKVEKSKCFALFDIDGNGKVEKVEKVEKSKRISVAGDGNPSPATEIQFGNRFPAVLLADCQNCNLKSPYHEKRETF